MAITSTTIQSTNTYQEGYWEIDMHDDGLSFSEVMIPVKPEVGMLVDCSVPDLRMVFKIVKITKEFDCDLVNAEIKWVLD